MTNKTQVPRLYGRAAERFLHTFCGEALRGPVAPGFIQGGTLHLFLLFEAGVDESCEDGSSVVCGGADVVNGGDVVFEDAGDVVGGVECPVRVQGGFYCVAATDAGGDAVDDDVPPRVIMDHGDADLGDGLCGTCADLVEPFVGPRFSRNGDADDELVGGADGLLVPGEISIERDVDGFRF